MSILGTLSEVFTPGSDDGGDGGGDVDGDTFEYRCVACDERFARSKTRMIGVRCPACGSMNVTVGDDDGDSGDGGDDA